MAEFTLDTLHTEAAQTVKIPEVDSAGAVVDHRFTVLALTRDVTRSYNRFLREVRELRADGDGASVDEEVDKIAALNIAGIALRLTPVGDAPPADVLLDRLWKGGRLSIDGHLSALVRHLYSGATEPNPPA